MTFSYVVNFRSYRTIRHVEGDIILQIPYIDALHQKDTSVQSLAKDPHLKDQLEEVVMSWERHVNAVIDSYLTKVQQIERPGLRKYYTLLGSLCVCVCVRVCMYVCVYMYICMYVRTYIHIYMHIHIHTHRYIHIHRHVRTYIRACVCTFDLRAYVCKCIQ